jgi:hypothetical protein
LRSANPAVCTLRSARFDDLNEGSGVSHLEGWARARYAALVPAAFSPQGTRLAYQPVPLGGHQVLSVHLGDHGGLQAAHG